MAAPNIVNVSQIVGKTAVANVVNSATTLVTNSSDSNKVFKINSIIASNIDTANTANISIDIFRSEYPYHIVRYVSIPSGSSLEVISKSIYLEEGDSIRTQGSTNNHLQIVCSYEEIL
jgi:hypothetical protein